MHKIWNKIGYNSEKSFNKLPRLNGLGQKRGDRNEKDALSKMGSTNINSLVFYRPSFWKCLECGYEGVLIIEDCEFPEKMQEHYQKRFGIIDWAEAELLLTIGMG